MKVLFKLTHYPAFIPRRVMGQFEAVVKGHDFSRAARAAK
jgi:hypothetical protein